MGACCWSQDALLFELNPANPDGRLTPMEFVSAVDWTRPEEEERWREEEVAAAVAGARRQMGEVVGRAEQVLLGKLGKQAGKTAAGGEREGMRGEERERMEEQEAKRARVLREARKAFAALGTSRLSVQVAAQPA